MTQDQIRKIQKATGNRTDRETIDAANLALTLLGEQPVVQDLQSANVVLRGLLQSFLDNDDYLAAGTLLWPEHMFNPNIQYTIDIFRAIIENNMLLVQGANGVSKSYACTAFMYLDWRRDPEFTMIKLAAVNEEHLKRTLIAQIHQFHASASIDLGLETSKNEMFFGMKDIPDMGIAGVLMPQGAEGTGRIRGYRPKPLRREKHPRFGYSTRTRFFGDEGQIYRASVFKDFGSLRSAMDGPDPVKIMIAYNPDSTDRPTVQMAMPKQGWLIEDLDTLYYWKSKQGWQVLRLDGAKCENVVQRKIIYPNLQTFEGFMGFVQSGGDTSADYFEKARGFPPIKGAVNIVIPVSYPQEYRGTANFVSPPMVGATIDCAYQGEDKAVMTLFRYGMASGWYREDGRRVEFTDYLNPGKPRHRHVLQFDQQIALTQREDTVRLGEEIVEKCKALNIDPKNVGIDGTGNGFGTYSHLKHKFGDVLLIQWAAKATEKKVMNEDQAPANAIYDTIISEMWFTVKRWLEGGCILISPVISHSPINQQLTTRRFSRVRGGLLHVESKREFKSRGNASPDEADSFVMAPLVVRFRHEILPGITIESKPTEEAPPEDQHHEPSEDKNLDVDHFEAARHIYESTP